jgi:hypothetical protein
MVLASPGPLFTPPLSSSPPKTPIRSYSARNPPCNENPTAPPPGGCGGCRQGLGMGGQKAQNGPQAFAEALRHQHHSATAYISLWAIFCFCKIKKEIIIRSLLLTTLQPTKRQPATTGAVQLVWRVTTARRTTTRAAPGCSPPPTYVRW